MMEVDYDVDCFDCLWWWVKVRYCGYEKVYYGNYFSGSYVLDIERVIVVDFGIYKVEVINFEINVGNEVIIELWYEGEKNEKFWLIFYIMLIYLFKNFLKVIFFKKLYEYYLMLSIK